MGDPRGFIKNSRSTPSRRPVDIRIKDWREVYEEQSFVDLQKQASRCMDCGIPFCHQECPLGNLIPEWNDLIWRSEKSEAIDRLHATNNFPEFTGRLCPAPCESACVLGINQEAVTIKQVELRTVEDAFQAGLIKPQAPDRLTGKTVAVIGSGPAGLAVAQQLTRAGHTVVVYERADKVGGLLRYGIPEFKMEKVVLDRRIAQMVREGTRFRTNIEVGADVTATNLKSKYDAIVLAIGATAARELPIPGRDYRNIYLAMDYLAKSNKESEISVAGKRVVILGGGDTGADCLGTALRQGAKSVTQIEIMERPSDHRPNSQPWPTHPVIFRTSSAHEEGGERVFSLATEKFLGNSAGEVTGLSVYETKFEAGKFVKVAGTEREIAADVILLALGFTGPSKSALTDALNIEFNERGNINRDENFSTNKPGIFVCGDAGRGQSLIVWAIAEGRSAAAAIDKFLVGSTQLPSPILTTSKSITV